MAPPDSTLGKQTGLNLVHLGEAIDPPVQWEVAFPRPEWNRPEHWFDARPEEAR